MSQGRLKIGAALGLTAPMVPLLFHGEEWGARTPFQYFTQHEDPGLAHAVSVGRRSEFAAFGWNPDDVPDPQDHATFERSKLDWDEPRSAAGAELLDWYRRLIRLRRTVPALSDGRMDKVRARFEDGVFEMQRGPVRVVANLGQKTARLATGEDEAVLLTSGSHAELEPDTVAILGRSTYPSIEAWVNRRAVRA